MYKEAAMGLVKALCFNVFMFLHKKAVVLLSEFVINYTYNNKWS